MMTLEDARKARNRVLMEVLESGVSVSGAVWSKHARERLSILKLQGLRVEDAERALAGRGVCYWSRKYGRPLVKYGDISVALEVMPDDAVLVVTALPATPEAWARTYESEYRVLGRQPRKHMTAAA